MAGNQIVEDNHPVAGSMERLGGVTANVPCAARDENVR
jgi:hypothetical protein